jgi:hypothetical protein
LLAFFSRKHRASSDAADATPLSHGLAAFVACAVLSLLAVNKFVPEGINADTLIQSIMSLQKLTIFYWGQNRFASVVPFLLSWIASPHLSDYPASCAHCPQFAISC